MLIGPNDITEAIKDIADLTGKVAANFRDRRVRKAIAERYDEMFRNPQVPVPLDQGLWPCHWRSFARTRGHANHPDLIDCQGRARQYWKQ
jgi:hypothetical protein